MLSLLISALPQHYRSKVEDIYNEYKEPLLYFAYRIVKDKEISCDIVHTAFEKIIMHIEKIDNMDRAGTKGYIILIVRNLCFDYLRKNKKAQTVPYESVEFSVRDNGASIEDIVMTGLDVNLVKDKLEELDEKYALPLILLYSMEFSYAEIAELLDITEQNARVRCFRGKKMLIEAIGKESNHGK